MNTENIQKQHLEAIENNISLAYNHEKGVSEVIGYTGKTSLTKQATKVTLQAMIDENKSILQMAEIHMDLRAVLVLSERIFNLNKQLKELQ